MTPDYVRAATSAYETLIKYGINSAPISPEQIIKQIPGVLVVSYTEMSEAIGVERKDLITAVGDSCLDAASSVRVHDGKLEYIIAYNRHLAYDILQRALARELGHIILGHDGTRPDDVRTEEARVFAKHLFHPRPVLYAIQQAGIPLTVNVITALSGCCDDCLACLRGTPGVHVDPELNRKVRNQFATYIDGYLDYVRLAPKDESEVADLGSFMDGYEE